VRKAGDCFALNWNRVPIDFVMKCLAKSNNVVVRNAIRGWCGRIGVEPESHAIEKMKTGGIDEVGPARLFVSSKKYRGGKDPLESSHQTPVVRTVFGEPKEIEHLGGRIEMDCPAFLLQSERRNPDGN
jgi:hypothetical protein